ncbi:2-amino-5-chloromuconic acid deaminase [Burkholderia pseudomultivorans]|uniref:2-amino-5-chloromuconic acid deaminase n=1 Tax=Burkholderia pseudomultivorans TaxID=1207504 RepID=A0A6P2LDM0_9BURK|nr:2-amino-5-chloromuconic acid deaminase [Burkholderia pseudomultivorans]MDR8738664.1 2-amino-5-chloromuconic acid deaminase [Burkholderia pseudomultivorans]MDR8745169.1 2-amino-5-chloromuconic acid deaminase [Burkholderia pseudomultivorans]MDR8757203.1 2-amino-5-chloromuconic acid deaminase [Burkholderia pseudomultivorans]MDR8781537.1 2-amino-5-chloromuconic acid deaminase [Burkholderia pseudomultivorans]
MSDACPSTALALTRRYAAGDTDPVRVARAALERAAAMPAVFLSVTPARALAAAAASATRWRLGQPLSALDGVPVAWKDLFDMAGTVTTAGAEAFRARAPAAHDAALVAAAERAGMVSIGKTNLSELAYSGLGLNPHFGTPTNPRLGRGTRVPGGSSSGAAIAVASDVVPISIGTDTAGSIRIPSAFNGLTGYRASTTRYTRDGVTPLSATLDTLGPLAHGVADCAAFDAAVRGAARPIDPASLRDHCFVVDPALLERYRVGTDVARNLRRFAERLAAAGARIVTRPLSTLADVHALIHAQGWLGALEAFDQYRGLLDSDDAQRLDPRVRTRLELARAVPAARLTELRAARTALIARFAAELGDATLLAPTVAHVAPPLAPLEADPTRFAEVNLQTLALTMPGSLLDTPAIAMPSGADAAGMPTGIQLMRAQGDDDRLLAVARAIETLPL